LVFFCGPLLPVILRAVVRAVSVVAARMCVGLNIACVDSTSNQLPVTQIQMAFALPVRRPTQVNRTSTQVNRTVTSAILLLLLNYDLF
jgi:hypothetical protein